MAVPKSGQAREYYRCAVQRYGEAEILISAGRTTGAVYLAGYGVECTLKALILTSVPAPRRPHMISLFRGGKAHDYGWLRTLYRQEGGAGFPGAIALRFSLVDQWSTDLRYVPRAYQVDEANEFLKATESIIRWANGRL